MEEIEIVENNENMAQPSPETEGGEFNAEDISPDDAAATLAFFTNLSERMNGSNPVPEDGEMEAEEEVEEEVPGDEEVVEEETVEESPEPEIDVETIKNELKNEVKEEIKKGMAEIRQFIKDSLNE